MSHDLPILLVQRLRLREAQEMVGHRLITPRILQLAAVQFQFSLIPQSSVDGKGLCSQRSLGKPGAFHTVAPPCDKSPETSLLSCRKSENHAREVLMGGTQP